MKILCLRNNCKLNEADQVRFVSAINKLESNTPFTFEIEWRDVSLPIAYKSFDDTSLIKGLYGLSGIKQDIRNLNIVDGYDIVYYFYESTMQGIAYWTYPTDLNGAVFCEIPLNDPWDTLEMAICHETLHAFHRMLNWKGIKSEDTMDKYDGNLDVMGGANYQRNLKELGNYWSKIEWTELNTYIEQRNNKPQYIIIHHTGGTNDTFESVKEYHISKGWGNIAYHYFIEKDGEVEIGRKEEEVGTHCIADGMNFKSIGICLSGNFEVENPTEEQLLSLGRLTKELAYHYKIEEQNILSHGKVTGAKTLCCGKNLQTHLDNRKRTLIVELLTKVAGFLKELLKLK